ncbi:MAG: NADH-quinone oxidoreductase subunit D, partial [Actinobacteria bacterium]|nr:NADH-quinone oxidoreductase subunit D [Actinomycetota bacterium]
MSTFASSRETTEGTIYSVTGGDWDQVASEIGSAKEERVVVNMGPQHPSTHGVLRLMLELEGETITELRCGIGYLHTGIEKNTEFRTWTQGVTFVTRMDYLSPLFNETTYCLGVEKLLGITNDVPERASVIRVMMMEFNRISSHMVALGTGALELGAITPMFFAFREREKVLDVFEKVSGLRMNMAYIRPGGVAQDLPEGTVAGIRELIKDLRKNFKDNAKLLIGNSIWIKRTKGVGYLDLAGCITLGVTGPVLRSTGMPWDLRKTQPYCGYENYDFDVITADTCDVYGRFLIRMQELEQSLRIIEQCCDKLDKLDGAPVMVADKKIAWPAQLSLGGDGLGNSLDHIRQIMGTSMEALIHHFKIVTEGFRVPAGQVYTPVESPRGELGAH